MKYFTKYYLFAVALVFLVTGCNKLDETVFSDLPADGYKSQPKDVYSFIGSVYPNMRGFYGHTGLFSMQQISTDALVLPANASGWDDGGRYKQFHQHTWTSGSSTFRGVWNNLYNGVLKCNRAILAFQSKTLTLPPGTTYEQFIAEAKVVRSFYYWLLMDNFGNVPYLTSVATSSADAGNIELPANSSRKAVYDSIVADISGSLDHLSEKADKSTYGRFNKWAAKTLLASVYLNAEVYTGQAKWNECLQQCNDVIGKYSLQPNYADCFSAKNENSVETIFAIPYDELNGMGIYINYTLHAASQAKYNLRTTPWGAGGEKAVSQFIDTYDPEDARIDDTWEHGLQFAADGVTPLLCTYDRKGQQINYSKDITNGLSTTEDEGYRIIKFRPETGAAFYMNNDFPFFRYAHVLMMKAECLLRTGNASEAAQIVTKIRERSFKNNPAKAIVTANQLTGDSKYNWGYYVKTYGTTTPGGLEKGDITSVKYGGFYDELGYEFAGEESRRRDMIRFGTFTKKSWLSHKPNGDYRIIYPIPQEALDANKKLKQNPGYPGTDN